MSDCSNTKKPRILVGVTGSVAAIKVPELVQSLLDAEFDVRLVLTSNSLKFVSQSAIPSNIKTYTDQDEWDAWTQRGDPVLHIQLRNWADLLLLAPLSANSLAKLAYGLADNLLTTLVRSWWFPDRATYALGKQVFFAPAMNTRMWEHPFTKEHIDRLINQLGWQCVWPISKTLVCGEQGLGAMAEVDQIVSVIKAYAHLGRIDVGLS